MKPLSDKAYNAIALLVIGVSLAYLTNLSWLKWTDILIDSGRELYVPKALAEGRLLYRDIFYVYGPFSPYFNALLYKIFGVHAYVLAAAGYAAMLAIIGLFHSLARIFLNRFDALFTTLSFLFLFPFGHHTGIPIFNYLIPYSYPAIHVLLFSLAALFFLHRHLSNRRVWDGRLVALFFLLAAITKAEVAVWLAISLFVGYWLHEKEASRGKGALMAFDRLAPPLAIAVVIYAAFYLQGSTANLQSSFVDSLRSNIIMPKKSYAWHNFTGGSLPENIWGIFLWTFRYVWIAGFLILGGRTYDKWKVYTDPLLRALRPVILVAAVVVGISILFFLPLSQPFGYFVPVPLFCVTTIILCRWKYWGQEKGHETDQILLICLAVFGFLLISRTLFNAAAMGMGFYLLVPGFLIYQILVLRVIPDLAGDKTSKWLLRVAFVGLGVFAVIQSLADMQVRYALVDSPLLNPKGTLKFQDASRVAAYRELIADLTQPEIRGKTLVVFPEGLWINYVTDLDNPLYFYQYLPIDFASPRSFDIMKNDMERGKPDFILVVDRNVMDYGENSLCEYAGPICDYLQNRYDFVKNYKDGVDLLLRKSSTQTPLY